MDEYIIEMCNITKEFPGIIANDDVTLQLKKGEIHALLGENGAGKSTLMSVLFGMYQPEKGVIRKNGQEVQIKDPNDANRLGIGMVHLQAGAQLHCAGKHHTGRGDHEPGLFENGQGPGKGNGPLGAVRPAGGPGRLYLRYYGGHAAACGDPEDAVP